MGNGWVTVLSVGVFAASWLAVAIAAGAGWMSQRETPKQNALAFSGVSFAVFWTFCGYRVVRSVFSGEAFDSANWSWVLNLTFDFSLSGWANFFGILFLGIFYVAVFAAMVGLTIWKVPTFDRSRTVFRKDATAFVAMLAVDYVWLAKVPTLLF